MVFTRLSSSSACKVFIKEIIICILICVISTCVCMYQNNDSVIATDYYYFAHRHSWVCYTCWSVINAWIVTTVYTLIFLTFIGFPVFINFFIFINNVLASITGLFTGNNDTPKTNMSTLAKYETFMKENK